MKTIQKLVLITFVIATGYCNTSFGADGETKTTEHLNKDENQQKFQELLFKAIETGNLKLVEEWLNRGAEVNSPNTNGRTPLIFAAYLRHQKIVELLLDRGASIDHKDSHGDTTLMYAMLTGRLDIIKLLLDRKANVDQKNKNGVTALMLAAHKSHENVVELLLDRKANINHKDSSGATALVCAAGEGCSEVVELLLNRGANIDHKDSDGDTALIAAADRGHKDIVELLLNRKANIDHKNKHGVTALMFAVNNGHKDVVELLLARGADKNARSKNTQRTALDIAKQTGNQEIIKLLTATDAAEGETKTTEQGDTSKNKFQNLLSKAIETGNLKLVEEWLNRGANVNAPDATAMTPLIFAAFGGRKEIVELLLDRGANIDHKDSDGTTALIAAAAKGHKEIVELLLDRGANIDHKDADCSTALMLAISNSHNNVVKLLLDRGADKNVRYKKFKGFTALRLAKQMDNQEIIKLLTEERPNKKPSDATTTSTNSTNTDETKDFDQVSAARATLPAENAKKPKKNNKNSAQQLISDLETLIIYDEHKALEKKLDNLDPEQNSNDKQTVVTQLVNFALSRDKYKAIQLLMNHQAVLTDDHYKQFVDAKNVSALEALLPMSCEEQKNTWSPQLDALKAELTREAEAAKVRAEQKERAAEKERLAQEQKDALELAEKQAAERARIAAQRNAATLEGAVVHLPNTQKIRAANPKKLLHKKQNNNQHKAHNKTMPQQKPTIIAPVEQDPVTKFIVKKYGSNSPATTRPIGLGELQTLAALRDRSAEMSPTERELLARAKNNAQHTDLGSKGNDDDDEKQPEVSIRPALLHNQETVALPILNEDGTDIVLLTRAHIALNDQKISPLLFPEYQQQPEKKQEAIWAALHRIIPGSVDDQPGDPTYSMDCEFGQQRINMVFARDNKIISAKPIMNSMAASKSKEIS